MLKSFSLTPRQSAAQAVLGGSAKHVMLFGGSRSGKTFLIVRAIVLRALAAKKSRHAILRFRFNHVKSAVIHDTFPKVMELCFPDIEYKLDKTDWFAELPNGSQIWFGGLDDKERTEKILGQEYATIFLNECSQIPWSSRNLAVTRLAQKVTYEANGEITELRQKLFYDCNPPSKAHWSYRVFVEKKDPENKGALSKPENFACFKINPADNLINLAEGYLETLGDLSSRLRKRFEHGDFADAVENALWTLEVIDRSRYGSDELPALQRIVVAVDPSGADDEDNTANDAIGIVVAALGSDGKGYLLEDLTIKAAPATWGKVATSAYERHRADLIVAEKNFGGAMVEHVVKTSNSRAAFKAVTASRGKVVRAEPISSLTETGKIRFVGNFPELEDELCSFTTTGYRGDGSPNRADAFVWAFSELFPGMVRELKDFHKPLEIDTSYIV
jgi:predicted phage terminase large subunit-like protein